MKRLTIVVSEDSSALVAHWASMVPDARWDVHGVTLYRNEGRLVACLYPESGWHPTKHMSRIVDLLVGNRERRVIGTHSEAIVCGIGDMIHDGKFNASDAEIHVVERDGVHVAGYDGDGALRDWPFGFFAPVRL
jgi:predicted ATPase